MVERLVLQARRTLTATIAVVSVLAVDILRKSPGKQELAGTRWPFEEQRVGYTPAVGHFAQAGLGFFVTGNVCESHGRRFSIVPCSATYSRTSWKRRVANTKSLRASLDVLYIGSYRQPIRDDPC